MRFDNPIYKHNFKKRYDIASFEELKNEYRQNRNIDCSYLIKYFRNNNFEKFNYELKNIIKLSYANKKKDPQEIEHYIKWKNKLDRNMVTFVSKKMEIVQYLKQAPYYTM